MISTFIRHTAAIIWSILCISSSLILMVIFMNRKLPLWMARKMWGPGVVFCYGAKLDVSGLENIDRSKSYIYMVNHQSFFDIPALYTALQVNLYFVGKEELKKMPFVGWYMMGVGMIFIDRSDRRKAVMSLRKAADMIDGGKDVLMFPEGTRTKNGEIGTFKKGTFVLASMTDVELMPIKLEGSSKVWNPDTQKITPGNVKVTVGKPISTTELNGKNMADFITDVRKKVIDL